MVRWFVIRELEEDKTDASCRILGDEKTQMKINNVKCLGIRKDNIKLGLKETVVWTRLIYIWKK